MLCMAHLDKHMYLVIYIGSANVVLLIPVKQGIFLVF